MQEAHYTIRRITINDFNAFERNNEQEFVRQPNEPGFYDRRQYGYYRCYYCRRTWESAFSWGRYGQVCMNCGSKVNAFYREEIYGLRETHNDLSKRHPVELCEMCGRVGDCREFDNN